MTDTRALQRTLFRMQMDPGFAGRVFAREEAAVASTGLGEADLGLLLAADPVAVRADRDGKRVRQMLGNVAAEFALSLAAARDPDELLAGFPASDEFHRAIAEDGSLPLSFGERVRSRAGEAPLPAALAALELALAHARRAPRPVPPPADGEVVLAPWAHLVDLPRGTHARAMELRSALDAGRPVAAILAAGLPAAESDGALETLLVVADPAKAGNRHRLPDVHVEEARGPVLRLLRRARLALDAEARRHLAAQVEAPVEALDAFVRELLDERVLIAG